MVFTDDTEVALAAATALVNTDSDPDALPDVAALSAFVRRWGWSGEHRGDDAELAQVRALRPRLRRIWETGEDGVVDIVNDFLREAQALPQLVRHDEWGYHLHATPAAAPLASRMAVEAAMAMVDVVRAGELARLGICASPTCDDVLIDLSKNRSRRFCDAGCGNKAAVAAYRARKSGRESDAKSTPS